MRQNTGSKTIEKRKQSDFETVQLEKATKSKKGKGDDSNGTKHLERRGGGPQMKKKRNKRCWEKRRL